MTTELFDAFDFFAGVPDSLLRPLCDYLIDRFGIGERHVIAANEGNAVALAAGYHLSTGKVPVVYLQNSGIGNIINPVASLMNDKVYGIPCVFVVGWRGEPGVHDEPQHIFQGEVTLQLLHDMDIDTFVIDKDTTTAQAQAALDSWQPRLAAGKQVAFVVKKGALCFDKKLRYANDHTMTREDIIRRITTVSGADPIVSTTGKASRELFEIREAAGVGHGYDLLTVGSMGHASSIAMAIAMQKPQKTVWCIDGDGAALMHMGAMALIGTSGLANLVHVVINNAAHETVGGMPTVADKVDLIGIARACGYPVCVRAEDSDALDKALREARQSKMLTFIEVKCAIGSRPDLGRPTTTARQNKESFMAQLRG